MNEIDKTYENFLLDISPRRVEDIIKRGEKYSSLRGDYVYPKNGDLFHLIQKSSDYEGSPTESISLKYLQGDAGAWWNAQSAWEVIIHYEESSDDKYDYVATVRRDMSTAYKARPSGPPRKVHFKLQPLITGWLGKALMADREKNPERMKLFYEQILYLEKAFVYADEICDNINNWAQSGMSMKLFCKCGRQPAVLSNERIAEFCRMGVDLSSLKQRLKCQKCGDSPTKIVPPSDQLNEMLYKALKSQPRKNERTF